LLSKTSRGEREREIRINLEMMSHVEIEREGREGTS